MAGAGAAALPDSPLSQRLYRLTGTLRTYPFYLLPVTLTGVTYLANNPDIHTMVETKETDDTLLLQIGSIGHWQTISFIVLSLFCVPAAWQSSVLVFHAPADVDFWCKPPPAFTNWTENQWRHYSTPHTIDQHGNPAWDRCQVYDIDYSRAPLRSSSPPERTSNVTEACPRHTNIPDRWRFGHDMYQWTIREQFGLVCEYDYLVGLISVSYHVGTMIGVFFGGMISDRFGRRPTMLILLGVMLLSGVAVTFARGVMMYMVLRFILALTVQAQCNTMFIICMEMVGGWWRAVLGLLFWVPYSLGVISLAGIASIITDWQHLQLASSVPLVLFFLYYWAVSESPRWLLAAGKINRAETIIESVAEINGLEYDCTVQLVPQHEERTHVHVKELLRHHRLRHRTELVWLLWLSVGLTYHGLLHCWLDVSRAGHASVALGGAADALGCLLGARVCLGLGRTRAAAAAMEVAGVCLMATVAVTRGQYHWDWPLLVLLFLARLSASAAFGTVYVYSAEVFPTGLRNTGIGSATAVSRLGAVLVPFVAQLSDYYTHLPALVMAACVMTAGGLPLWLLETQHLKLPDTMHEADQMTRRGAADQTMSFTTPAQNGAEQQPAGPAGNLNSYFVSTEDQV